MQTVAGDRIPGEAGWFSVRCVFRSVFGGSAVYEERVTLWRAEGFAEAIALAEAEATEYAEDCASVYAGLAQAYRLFDEPGSGAEVFSLMRASELTPQAYLDRFFDTGAERQGMVVGEPSPARPEGER